MKEDFKWYLAGLFDGEGSLQVRLREDVRYKAKYHTILRVEVSQKRPSVLRLLQKELQMGYLHHDKKRDIWSFYVHKLADIKKFIETVDGKLHVKNEEMQRFKMCIEMLDRKQHLTVDGVENIKQMWRPQSRN